MSSVYIAAPFAARDFAREVSDKIQAAGHTVTSKWVFSEREINSGTIGTSEDSTDDVAQSHAVSDLSSVMVSDHVLHLTSAACAIYAPEVPQEWLHTGGRHVEMGFALANSVPVHILGEPENIFARTLATQHTSVEDFLASIK